MSAEFDPQPEPPGRSRLVRVVAILWPAFVAAGVLEMLTFAVLDPRTMHEFGGSAPTSLSIEAIYTLTFLLYWAMFAITSAVTQAQLVNAPRAARP